MGVRSSGSGLGTLVAAGVVLAGLSVSALAQSQRPTDPLRVTTATGHFKLGIEAGLLITGQNRAFWDLSRRFSPSSPFATRLAWGEGYVTPSLSFEFTLSPPLSIYGGLSAIASGTAQRDVFDIGNIGRIGLENAFVGLRHGTPGQGFFFDASGGAQPYRIGSGMLIADGGADGFERGALIFGPRRAWAMTAIARVGYGPVAIDGYFLRPNELRSADTRTTIAGVKAEWTIGRDQYVGATIGRVLTSTAPYAQAPPFGIGAPAVLLDARDGLEFANLYARFNPLPGVLPGLWLSGDLALQRNDRNDLRAWAGRAEIGYAFADLPWRPTLSYAFQTFSGDDPRTGRLERFDPLFYDGGQAAWATGTNGSFVFINSNVNAHRVALSLQPSPGDFLTLRYAHVRANELNSPIQFGQGTRLSIVGRTPVLVAGVANAHLSDDVLAEYTRVITPNVFLTVGAGYSIPGAGLRQAARPSRIGDWAGAFANIVVRY